MCWRVKPQNECNDSTILRNTQPTLFSCSDSVYHQPVPSMEDASKKLNGIKRFNCKGALLISLYIVAQTDAVVVVV